MIGSIIVGALCGWLASLIMKTDAEMGAIKNILAGIIGGVIGNFVLGLLGLQNTGNLIGNIVSGVIGACILIAIVRALSGRR